jgi:hypothetical protein
MQEQSAFTEQGVVVHEAEPFEDAPSFRNNEPRRAFVVTVGNVDLPAYVSDGAVYIQAPLPLVFEAFAESISDFVRDLEVRVSDTRGRALSLDGAGRALLAPRMAESGVVRGSWQ